MTPKRSSRGESWNIVIFTTKVHTRNRETQKSKIEEKKKRKASETTQQQQKEKKKKKHA